MSVSLPSSDDVRKAREQAAKSAAAGAQMARTPLLAMLGAGEFAMNAVTKAVHDARHRGDEQSADAQQRFADLQGKMNAEELRKLLEELRAHVEQLYTEFAERGEQTWEQLRGQPQFQQAVSTLKAYSDKLDSQVDTLVDDARGASERTLKTVSKQTRTAGEAIARVTHRNSDAAAKTVADTGAAVAEGISTAGAHASDEVRLVTEKAADATAVAEKSAAEKPTATPSADGAKPES